MTALGVLYFRRYIHVKLFSFTLCAGSLNVCGVAGIVCGECCVFLGVELNMGRQDVVSTDAQW